MSQTGKMSAEPPRIESKRERRRGAAGRAAALRRAPSDSDCSGETASLSADSGERTARQQLPPLRTGKASRRRGSEWEVLEGLKDGQRFDKRPDVFNGYLHKKRKWPLKGWHKRFFVIDGGILVYARSPGDVARGRLHGSVDVGLSVISAKARRRRIDIDADEFIYHLRAKTPDVFRTWLQVLKAHRLYRQHLLTFGARESVPKIHVPADELPATDTSSRTSGENSISTSNSEEPIQILNKPNSPLHVEPTSLNTDENQISTTEAKSLIPLDLETFEINEFDLKINHRLYKTKGSLCSMKCVSKKFLDRLITKKKSLTVSVDSTEAEHQMVSTDLNSLKNNIAELKKTSKGSPKKNSSVFSQKAPATTCFFFTKKGAKSFESDSQIMKRSKKCTNLVKYRNLFDEPPLKRHSSKCLLLGARPTKKRKDKKDPVILPATCKEIKDIVPSKCKLNSKAVACETCPTQVEVEVQIGTTISKYSQNVNTVTDYDKITRDLMVQIFHCNTTKDRDQETTFYIYRLIKDLYEFKVDRQQQPVQVLFRSLLEYWLKNTNTSGFKEAMTSVKSVDRQSNKHFTRNEKCSGLNILKVEKETQFIELQDIPNYHKPKAATLGQTYPVNRRPEIPLNISSPRHDTASFEKERRIQELERLLKNTVYVCETTKHNNMSREKDIKMTKKLMDNLDRRSNKFEMPPSDEVPLEKSSSSAELPKLEETINNLISDTSIPPDVAKEFLGAYLGVLLNDNKSKSTTTSLSSEWSTPSKEPAVEVVTEAVTKKVSKSVTTLNVPDNSKIGEFETNVDPGQIYLRDIIEKITTIFSTVKSHNEHWEKEIKAEPIKTMDDKADNTAKDELGRAVMKSSKTNIIYENCEDHSLVIDLSRYNLEHIAMYHDPSSKDMMSITIRLKEKPLHHGETAQPRLNLKFSEDQKTRLCEVNKADDWMCLVNDHTPSADIFNKKPLIKPEPFKYDEDLIELKPYLSASDATSKAYKGLYGNSLLDTKTDSLNNTAVEMNDDNQCYLMSFTKGLLASSLLFKRDVKPKEAELTSLISKETSVSKTRIEKPKELTIFEKPTPRIIDEKFILLLLENLMLLSKSVPILYKDINNLYVKLNKKHEKLIKNCENIQGLSLLGKIYNENIAKRTKNMSTQYELNVIPEKIDNRKTMATNTYHNITIDKSVITDTDTPSFSTTNKKEPIERIAKMTSLSSKTDPSKKEKLERVFTETETAKITTVDVAISVQNWTKIARECALSSLVKYVMNKSSMRIARPMGDLEQMKIPKLPMKIRQQVYRGMNLLAPCNMRSNQSQTDDYFAVEKQLDEDFNVYQLYLSKIYSLKGSCSEINIELVKSEDLKTLYRCSSGPSFSSGLLSPTSPAIRGPQAGFVSGTPGGRLASWIIESGGPLENASRELGQAQLSVQQLQRLLDALELQQQVHHDTDVSLEGASPNVKKDRRKFGLRKKKSNSKCASVELQPPHIDPSTSHTALSALTAPPSPGGGASSVPNSAASLPIACAAARPQSLPGAESLATAPGPASLTSLTPDHQLREDFTVLAKDLVTSLKGIVSTLVCERGRLRAAMEAAEAAPASGVVAALTNNLTTALHQNSELRTRLSRIHDASDIAEICSVGNNSDAATRQFQQSLSYSSSCVSASEFFDAEEHDDDDDIKVDDLPVIPADEAGVIELDGDSSSEAGSLTSEEGSASSDNSDGKTSVASAEAITLRAGDGPAGSWSRRTRLPSPRPTPGGPSLWNLLYKNIGKDLSQISMPVTINEPLNMLQRLCEELEYCELLDLAAGSRCGVERAALVAAFAVSAYAAAAHRAASKPFNPLLAETYECVRDDKGFKFLAEQVSHHPPISACHAESARWCFWQEARIKTKFWGKSMEFQPTGKVHVRLRTTGDHYTWNKVTTCVHNLFGGQRWVDQYGDMHIACVGTDITCKLSFIKASSWSQSRHEVRGAVVSGRGQRLRLSGRWSEALYAGDPPSARCLWRPGAMPPEHEMYYGFTRFAMELNEMEPLMKEILPHTDTRFRPDQRALEEGDVDTAETLKHELEQAQRERRRDNMHHTAAWFRKTMEDGEETWVFSGEYWKVRETGFPEDIAPRIW